MTPRTLLRKIFRKTARPVSNLRPHNPHIKDILLACSNAMTAEYLRDFWQLLQNDCRLKFSITMALPEDKPGSHDRIREILPLEEVHVRWAHVKRWDAIVMADHGFRDLANPRWSNIIRIPHGICSGKLNNAVKTDHAYSKLALDSNGKPNYTRMFESSLVNRDHAVSLNPEFENIITVVGSATQDKLIDLMDDRDNIRRNMGYGPDDTVVFVVSTCGDKCLFRRMGDELLAEARSVGGDTHFIFSAHPHEYRPQPDGQRVWGEYLKEQTKYGFVIRHPHEDWMPYVAACDIMLTDPTSMAVYGALVGRPIIFVPMPSAWLEEGSFLWRLHQIAPKMKHIGDLRKCMLKAKYEYPYDSLRKIASEINSYPGQSRQRIRQELYGLINLTLPTT